MGRAGQGRQQLGGAAGLGSWESGLAGLQTGQEATGWDSQVEQLLGQALRLLAGSMAAA